jgi:hypothetical protein
MPGKQDGSAIAGIEDVFIALDGPQPSATLSKNISKDERQHRGLSAPLRSGRDDKGEGGVSSCDRLLVKRTADPSTARRYRSASLGMTKGRALPWKAVAEPEASS